MAGRGVGANGAYQETQDVLASIENGRPLKNDVRKLCDWLKTKLQPGTVISHDELECEIGEPRKSTRYRTVISYARKLLHRETGFVLDSLTGIGYQVPNGVEQFRVGVNKHRNAVKALTRAVDTIGSIEDCRLPSEKFVAARDHYARMLSYRIEEEKHHVSLEQLTIGKLMPPQESAES